MYVTQMEMSSAEIGLLVRSTTAHTYVDRHNPTPFHMYLVALLRDR